MVTDPPAAPDVRLHASADHVTPYDRLVWTDDDVEKLLASGSQRPELEAFFGEDEYRELARLARTAQSAARAAHSLRTIVVPGIMGSQLGLPRHEPLPRDILWIDPTDIGFGRLTELAMPGAAAMKPYGVVLYSYLRIKLHLRAAGFDAAFHHYDWRLGIDELGRELAERLRAEPADRVALVGHSLGGLVSRAALGYPGGDKVERLVLLGTPNGGSFAAVQALRGTNSVVRKIAQLDGYHTAEVLAARVFSTFPSLYHMLPSAGHSGTIDLLDPSAWPRSGPQPSADLLASSRTVRRVLPPPDERCAAIVGVGQETVTAVARRGDEFVYTVTRHGDGTVPVSCARLDGARNYHAAVAHSDLTRDRTVCAAVVDLLRGGTTRRLASGWTSASVAEARVSDSELGRTRTEKVDWAGLTAEKRRIFLQTLSEEPKLQLRVPAQVRRRRRLGRR